MPPSASSPPPRPSFDPKQWNSMQWDSKQWKSKQWDSRQGNPKQWSSRNAFIKSPSSSSNDGKQSSLCSVFFCLSCPPLFDDEEPQQIGCTIINEKDKGLYYQKPSWRTQLLRFSTWASMLCVLDCTVLPLLTILFPLLGWMDGLLDASWLDEVGHAVALCVVLPIGGLATTTNYCLAHRRLWIAAVGWTGMLAIAAANGGLRGMPLALGDNVLGRVVGSFLHLVAHGPAHRAANLTGCALLMGSNYLSKTAVPKQL